MKRLINNAVSLFSLQLFSYILPLITVPYLVRVLGVERFGLISFSQALIAYFLVITDFGFNLSATQAISEARGNSKKINEIYSYVIYSKILLVLLCSFVFVILVSNVNFFQKEKLFYLFAFLLVLSSSFSTSWYFQGIEKMQYISRITILTSILSTIGIFSLIRQESDYILYPLIMACTSAFSVLVSFYFIKVKFKQRFLAPSLNVLKSYFINNLAFFLSRVSVSLNTVSNTFILGIATTTTVVGYYAAAEKIYKAMIAMYAPISQSLYPYMVVEKNLILYKKVFFILNIVNVLLIVFIFMFGDLLFDFLFTQQVGSESLGIFHILLFSALVMVPSILLGYPFLGAFGLVSYANKSVIYASVFHLIGLIILYLAGNISAKNVSVLVVCTQFLDLSYRVYGVKKNKLWKQRETF